MIQAPGYTATTNLKQGTLAPLFSERELNLVQMSRSLPLPVPYSSIHYVRLATACLVLAVFSTVHFSGCNESEVRPQNKCRTGSGSDRAHGSIQTRAVKKHCPLLLCVSLFEAGRYRSRFRIC